MQTHDFRVDCRVLSTRWSGTSCGVHQQYQKCFASAKYQRSCMYYMPVIKDSYWIEPGQNTFVKHFYE